MRPAKASLPAVLLLVLLTGCGASAPPAVTLPGAPPPRDEAALAAAVEAYYTAPTPEAMRGAVEQARVAGPGASLYHEIAADLARFEDRPRDELNHLLSALLDPGADAPVLYLHRLAELNWTLDERARLLPVLAAVRAEHQNPEARAFAAWMHGHALHLGGDAAARDAAVADVGSLLPFALIGPWDNDQGKGFDAEHPPEREIDLRARYAGKLVEIGWRTDYARDPRGKTDLASALEPNQWQIAYAVAAVEVAEGGDYELRVSTSDPVRIWVNQVEVFEGRRLSAWLFDGLVLPVRLRPGVNQVLVKSAQQTGEWLLAARITRPGGEPVPATGLRFVPADTPFADGAAPAADKIDEERLLAARVRRIPEGTARRDFLQTMWAEDMGLTVPAVALAEAFNAAHPDSLRGRYLLALTLWENQERGRTADLLNALVAEFGEALIYLPLQQARFWRQQKLETKARELVAKLRKAHPEHPTPLLVLADILEHEEWHEDRCSALEEANQRWPGWPQVMLELAECYEALHFYPRATEVYRAVTAALPWHGKALRSLHWMAEGNDDFVAAEGYARTLTRAWPHERSSWARLGETRRRAGDEAGAHAAWSKLVELAPTAADGYVRLSRLALQAKDTTRAVDLWKQALERDPENEKLANRLAWLAPEQEGAWARDVPDEAAIEAVVAGRDKVQVAEGANVVYLLDDEVTSLGADGSTNNVVTMVAHAVNQEGRDYLTRMTLRSGRTRVLQAYAVDSAGRRMEASSIRGRTVRFRQLDVGSTVVLQYRVDERPDGYLAGHLARQWWFQAPAVQTVRGRWVLWTPRGVELREDVLGGVEREERRVGDQLRVSWTAQDTPPLLTEPGMPTLQEVAAHVVVSTVPDWQMFWKWEQALLDDAFRQSPELVALANRLLKDADDPLEKVRRIHAYLMTDIRYQQDYEKHIAGVKPHPAPVVVARQYGDCKDKAVLFITLARIAGLEAHFALVRTRDAGPVRRAVPMQQFNHAIVYVPEQPGIGEARFYDPTVDALDVDVLRHDDQGTWSLVFNPYDKSHTWREIPYQAPEVDYFASHTDLHLTADGGAAGSIAIEAHGQAGDGFRRGARNPEQFRQMLQQQIGQTYPGARLKGFEPTQVQDVRRPAQLRVSLETSALGRREGNELRLRLPVGWSPQRWFTLTERQYPLLLGAPRSMRWRVEMALPEGGRVKRLPDATRVASECLTLERTLHVAEGKVVAEQEVQIRCERISVEDYAEHRRSAEEMHRLLEQELVVDVSRSKQSPPAKPTERRGTPETAAR